MTDYQKYIDSLTNNARFLLQTPRHFDALHHHLRRLNDDDLDKIRELGMALCDCVDVEREMRVEGTHARLDRARDSSRR